MIERIKSFVFRQPGNRRVRSVRTSSPASSRLEAFRRWIVWLIALGLVLFVVVALASFSAADPAWSTTGSALRVKNWLGLTGAWLSDIGYFVLGATVWWLVAFAVLAVWRAMPSMPRSFVRSSVAHDDSNVDQTLTLGPSWRVAGLILLVLVSGTLEAVGMHRMLACRKERAERLDKRSRSHYSTPSVSFRAHYC
jgi:DNA segregation ATPase FtsK/SpoIIIE, S-DNA-T family